MEGGSADEDDGRRGELTTVAAGAPMAAVEGDGSTVWGFDEGKRTNHSDRCGDNGDGGGDHGRGGADHGGGGGGEWSVGGNDGGVLLRQRGGGWYTPLMGVTVDFLHATLDQISSSIRLRMFRSGSPDSFLIRSDCHSAQLLL